MGLILQRQSPKRCCTNKVMNGMPIYHLFPLGIGDLPSVSSLLHSPSLVNYKLIKSTMETMHPWPACLHSFLSSGWITDVKVVMSFLLVQFWPQFWLCQKKILMWVHARLFVKYTGIWKWALWSWSNLKKNISLTALFLGSGLHQK